MIAHDGCDFRACATDTFTSFVSVGMCTSESRLM
jgi:hypothetical protein